MFRKSTFGFGLAGKLKKYAAHYSRRRNVIFDVTTVQCSVNSWIGGFAFNCSCFCNDALGPTNGNRLSLYSSRMYETRQEAEAELDVAIVSASKEFPGTSFYRCRYYPEHGATGESLCCLNGEWTESASQLLGICAGCGCRYSEYPENKICNQCGEILN